MTIGLHPVELRMIRAADGLDIDLDALQGLWSVQQYLKLSDQTNRLLEFTDGAMEVLPMPTRRHQIILLFLYDLLKSLLQSTGGKVLVAPMRMQIHPHKYREPDILLLCNRDDPRNQEAFWLGADLVVEIVSPDNPERDIVEKPYDYAQAGIPEYWIVNPMNETITVLALLGGAYETHGVFQRGELASSRLLEGFDVAVDAVFDAN